MYNYNTAALSPFSHFTSSGLHAGTWGHPGSGGIQKHKTEETNHKFLRWRCCDVRKPPAASEPFPHHHEAARHGLGSHQTGDKTAVLHHLRSHTQQPAAEEGHVLLEQRPADQVQQRLHTGRLKFYAFCPVIGSFNMSSTITLQHNRFKSVHQSQYSGRCHCCFHQSWQFWSCHVFIVNSQCGDPVL